MSSKFSAGGIKAGSTSVTVPLLIQAVSTGAAKLGVVANMYITFAYWRVGSAPVAITTTPKAVGDAWVSGGLAEAAYGMYKLDVPDAAFAAGVEWVAIQVSMAGPSPTFQPYMVVYALEANTLGETYSYANNAYSAASTASSAATGASSYSQAIRAMLDPTLADREIRSLITGIQSNLTAGVMISAGQSTYNSGGVTVTGMVSGVINAASIAAGAITDDKFAADVATGKVHEAASVALSDINLDHLLKNPSAVTFDGESYSYPDIQTTSVLGRALGTQFGSWDGGFYHSLSTLYGSIGGIPSYVWSYVTGNIVTSTTSIGGKIKAWLATLGSDSKVALSTDVGAHTGVILPTVTSVGSVAGDIGGKVTGSVNNVLEDVHTDDDSVAQIAAVLTGSDILTKIDTDTLALTEYLTRTMGPGATLWSHEVFAGPLDTDPPLDGVTIWITSDEAGDDVVAGPQLSNPLGITKWMLTAGAFYYLWRQKPHYSFDNPIQIQVV